MSLFTALLCSAWATTVRIDATVADDLRSITGTLTVVDAPSDWRWVDPLAQMPVPGHELDVLRTYPESPNQGSVRRERVGDTWTFTTTMPRRYGDVGVTPNGLFANGWWYPQPLDRTGGLPMADWEVHLALPEQAVGAVGDSVGSGVLSWTGTAERAAIAVLPKGVVTRMSSDGWTVDVVSRRPLKKRVRKQLQWQLELSEIDGVPRHTAAVIAPLRRRLSRHGPDLAYLSDRTWALTPLFERLHHASTVRALYAASSGQVDPFLRQVESAALSREHIRRYLGRQKVDLLGLTSWLAIVDSVLYDREMAFQHGIFRTTHPTDRLEDDLYEHFSESTAGTVVVAQLADVHGDDTIRELGHLMALGWSLEDAAARLDVATGWFERWHEDYPHEQDYTLALRGKTVTIRRDAPADALPEIVTVAIDGKTQRWETDRGSDHTHIELEERPKRVQLDPKGHLGQLTRVGELRPAPIRWTLSGAISGINVSEGFLTAYAVLSVRKADDTLNRWLIWGFTNQRDRIRIRASYTRYAGPLRRGTTRQHAVSLSAETAWLNTRFADVDGAPIALGGSVSYAWDNRVYSLFPLQGARLSFGVSGGGTPATGETYLSLSGSVIGQAAPTPRHVFAGKLSAGRAWSDIPQRRLRFGGDGGVRGIPDNAVQTEVQAVASMEYRAVLMRQGNIPMLLTWVRELQLVTGVDIGAGSRSDGPPVRAMGLNAGLGVITDNLGISPGAVNLTFGVPIWWRGVELDGPAWPYELYLTWGQMY